MPQASNVAGTLGLRPSGYTYTTQREDLGGLMDYRARYYDSYINRFIQADTIVSNPGKSQNYNRYMFVAGNPLKYTDPTGHITRGEQDDANEIVELLLLHGVKINVDWKWVDPLFGSKHWHAGVWELAELVHVRDAVLTMAGELDGADGFRDTVLKGGSMKIIRKDDSFQGYASGRRVFLGNEMFSRPSGYDWLAQVGVVHEIAHIWDNVYRGNLSKDLHAFVNGEPGPTPYGDPDKTWADYPIAEEWAESVATYFYPGYTNNWLQSKVAGDAYNATSAWATDYASKENIVGLPGLLTYHELFLDLKVGKLP